MPARETDPTSKIKASERRDTTQRQNNGETLARRDGFVAPIERWRALGGRAAAMQPQHAAWDFLNLQRTLGNRYVQRVIRQARDSAEAEQRPPRELAPEARLEALVHLPPEPRAGPEHHEPLGSDTARHFGEQLSADFSGVRAHTGDRVAEEHGAAAITFGHDIHFAHGVEIGDAALLGHELVHTVQQGAVPVRGGPPAEPGTKAATESEASRLGPAAAEGRPGTVQYAAPEGRPVPVRSAAPAPATDPLAPVEALQKDAARLSDGRVSAPAVTAAAPPSAVPTTRPSAAPDGRPSVAAAPPPAQPGATPSPRRAGAPGVGDVPAAAPTARVRPARTVPQPRAAVPAPRLAATALTGARPPVAPAAPPTPPAVPHPDIPAAAPSAELGQSVITEGAQLAAKIRQAASAAAASIRATAQEQITRLYTDQAAHTATLTGHVSSGHEAMATHEQSAIAEAHSGAQAAQATVSAAGQDASTRVQQGGERERQRAPQTGDQAGADFDAAAADEATRFQQGSEARTAQAQGSAGGDGDSAAAQAEAAEKIGNQAAQNFAKDAANVQGETQRAAGEFRGYLQQGVSGFMGAIEQAVPQLTSGISGLVEAAHSGFGDTAERAASSMSAFASHVTEQLSEGAAAAESYLASGVEATVNSFQSIAEHYAAEVEQRGAQLADALEQQAHAAGTSIAQAPTEHAQRLVVDVRTQFQDAATQATTGLSRIDTQVSGGLAKHGAAAATEMSKATAEAGNQIRTTIGQAGQKLVQAQTQITQQLALGAQTVGQQVQQTSTDAAAELERQGTDFGTRIQQGTQQARQHLATTVDKAASDQQANAETFQGRKSSAAAEIASQYGSLQSQADSRSQAEQSQNASQGQPFLDWILPASWTKAIKQWFADTFGKWLGGFLYGIISALIGLVIVLAILAIIAAVFTPFVAAVVGIGILIVAGVAGIISRFKMFEAYNGRGPGFWEGVGLVTLGILDITGVPQIIEGLVGYRAFSNGHKMDDFEAGENVGSGLVQLIAIFFAVRGLKGGARPVEVKPPEVEPPVRPPEPTPKPEPRPAEPQPAPRYDPRLKSDLDLNLDTDPTLRPGETPEQAQARAQAAKEELARRGAMPMCFIAGTLVQTPDGPVPIDALAPGQFVLAKGEDRPVQAYRVLNCMHSQTANLYHVEVAGACTLTTTRNHPFFVAGKGWTTVKDLAMGDELITLNGSSVPVTAVLRERLDEPVATFNIHVEGVSSYFVGDGIAVWVHNADPKDPIFKERLLWGLGASGPRQRLPDLAAGRAGDIDGASSWVTNSPEEAGRFLGVRATQQAAKGNHGAITEAQLAAKGLVAVPTKGEGPLADAGFQHMSIRPQSNPDPLVNLTEAEMAEVQAKLAEVKPVVTAKPKDFGCG